MDVLSSNGSESLLSWYVLFTRPHQEDRAANNLRAWGIHSLIPKLKPKKGSKQCRPLFPSYVFAQFDATTKLHTIRFTRGISYVVSFGGKPAQIANEIIGEICSRMDGKGIISGASGMAPGESVVIQSGPLRDFQGVFEQELSDHERVRILLTTVAYTLHIQVSKSLVRSAQQNLRSWGSQRRPEVIPFAIPS